MKLFGGWQTFAIGSAFFAAPTAIFGKLGVADTDVSCESLARSAQLVTNPQRGRE